jgi:hypothetical protein
MDRGRLVGLMISTLTTTLFLVLGGCWVADRTHHWETPRLDPGRFSRVSDTGADGAANGWVMMPVNLRCPHCLASLRALQRSRRSGNEPGLVVLIVDQDREPSSKSVAALRAEAVWWDRSGVWRKRWGHRLYGERLCFDAQGRYLETLPPASSSSVALETKSLPEGGEAP